ncbi:hypothetical protein ACM39_12230 [Chryseobacterium sp. FH2]|nr:hypothetical protein ACM39_12230 [Chryseobacterium sp. FH2]
MLGTMKINAQQEVIIGTGTNDWYYSPITRLFENGASETIYDSSDIGITGNISAVGWNITANAYATTTGNVSIYMKMTDQSTIANTASLAGYSLVYSGNVDNNVLGWQNIQLTTPFNYNDSTKNLMVLVVHTSGNYTLSPPRYSYTTATNKASYYSSISNVWNETRTMTLTPNRTNIKLYFTQNLSTVEIEGNTSLKYYPNPVKDILTISANQNITSVEVYNMMGQQILTKKSDSKEISLDLINISSGNYLVKLTYKNGSSKTIKIIKQ